MKEKQEARDAKRQQEEGTRKQQEEIRKQEEETRKRLIEEDKKYDRVINCPTCKGFGETYIGRRYYYDENLSPNDMMRRSMFWILSGDYLECKEWVDENDETIEVTKGECPHCRKTGSVYAWFEKNAIWHKACKKCNKSGKLRIKEKLEIGIGEKEIHCDNCNGTGKVVYSGEIVHIKTKGGWYKEQLLENEEELQENDNVLFYPEVLDGANPCKFYVEITNKNRDFYSKSQPR
jgi:DnaJ-class molecular chaperone